MSISCVDCANCGKCYSKEAGCPDCGGTINLLEASCPVCGKPITEEMRERARKAYMQQKQNEREALFPGLKANREKRQRWLRNHSPQE